MGHPQAGSGKSTLMKYLLSNGNTKRYLQNWAGDSPWTLSTFFFWALGTLEQKTQDGLSRALLYNIIATDRSLIRKLLPSMWREAYEQGNDGLSSPSCAEMKLAFNVIAKSEDLEKFCFFDRWS